MCKPFRAHSPAWSEAIDEGSLRPSFWIHRSWLTQGEQLWIVAVPGRRPLSETRRIVELKFRPGASVDQIAQVNGLTANQVLKWRRAFERGELTEPSCSGTRALLPVTVPALCEAVTREALASTPATSVSIHFERDSPVFMRVMWMISFRFHGILRP